jgi:molybdate/tungstate transport system permease protein
MKKPSALTLAFSLLGAAVVLFLLAPILKMLLSVQPGSFFEALADAEVRRSILLTFVCATWATLLGALSGVPLAYLLARQSFPGKNFIEALVDVPVVIPHPVAGIALLLVFGRQFFGGRFFGHFGLSFIGTAPGIVIAMIFVSASFLINASRDGFRQVDPRLENVARTLGYGPLATFFSVSLPLSWRNVLSGAILMWARAISEFGAIVIITYNPKVASILIYDRFTTYGLTYALPLAVILIVLTLAVFALLRGISYRDAGVRAS